MRRPPQWATFWISLSLGLVLGMTLVCFGALPLLLRLVSKQILGPNATIQSITWQLPLGVKLKGVQLNDRSMDAGGSLKQIAVQFRGISFGRRVIWVSVLVDRAALRVTRGSDGHMILPNIPVLKKSSQWRIHPKSVQFTESTFEFIDQTPETPVRLLVDRLYAVLNNSVKLDGGFLRAGAMRGDVISPLGDVAGLACSGWGEQGGQLADVKCHLEEFPLRVLEPYFSRMRTVKIRPYEVTFSLTGGVEISSGQVWTDVFLKFAQLYEGNVTIRGRNIIDLKNYEPLVLAKNKEVMTELRIFDQRNQPDALQMSIYPADEILNTYFQLLIDKDRFEFKKPLAGRPAQIKLHSSSDVLIQNLQKQRQAILNSLDMVREPLVQSIEDLFEEYTLQEKLRQLEEGQRVGPAVAHVDLEAQQAAHAVRNPDLGRTLK